MEILVGGRLPTVPDLPPTVYAPRICHAGLHRQPRYGPFPVHRRRRSRRATGGAGRVDALAQPARHPLRHRGGALAEDESHRSRPQRHPRADALGR
ncbi:MAG: hypothetical protein BAJATHORv1_150009 [Candidatus Thorarchaeota archaeon]|nr:MAG: hypothetical protein BAJATHORv1_150009 [Candidatus Thorarchaeota archaeon]